MAERNKFDEIRHLRAEIARIQQRIQAYKGVDLSKDFRILIGLEVQLKKLLRES